MSGDTVHLFSIQPTQNVTENDTMDYNNSFYDDQLLNNTSYVDFTQLNWVLIILVVLYLGVMTLAIAGNTMLFVTVARDPQLHKLVNCYIVNLGVCDFLVGVFVLPVKLLELTAPPRLSILTDGLCTAVTYSQTVVVFSSVLTLVATCIDRHFAVVHPFEWQAERSKGRAKVILLTTWLIPCIVASPHLYGSEALENSLESDYGTIHRITCFDGFSNKFRVGYFIFLFIFLYFLPLCFITGTCFNIAKELLKRLALYREGDLRRQEKTIRKSAKMIIVVVIAFTISWTPYFLVTLVTQVHTSNFLQDRQFFFTMLCLNLFAFLNSCVNPFIYVLMSKRFRNGFENIVCFLSCRNQYRVNSGSSNQRHRGRAAGGGSSTTDPSISGSAQFTILRLDSLRTFTNFSRRTLSAVWRRGSSKFNNHSLKRSRSNKSRCNGSHNQSLCVNGDAVVWKSQSSDREDDAIQVQQLLPVHGAELPLFVPVRETNPLKDDLVLCKPIHWNSIPNLANFDNTTKESLLRKSSSATIITVISESIV